MKLAVRSNLPSKEQVLDDERSHAPRQPQGIAQSSAQSSCRSGEAVSDPDEIVAEDWPTYYTQVPVWILLASTTAQAYRMYAFLAEHINNRQPGKRISCPKQKAIALVLGLSNHRQVGRYGAELEALGALSIEEYRYSGGMRRGYRYHVRFNPPPGYQGLIALSQFYEANPHVRSAQAQGRVAAALSEPTGRHGGPENSTTGGTKNSPSHGAPKSPSHGPRNRSPKRNQPEVDQEERDHAPSARRAPDGRRPSTGGRAAGGGSAASGNTQRLTPQEGKRVAAFVRALPEHVAKHVPARRPAVLSRAILEALAVGSPHERTPEQLAEFRALVRWDKHWGSVFGRGEVKSAVGALVAMVERKTECGSPRCDERTDVDTGQPCTSCAVRVEDRRQQRRPADGRSAAPQPSAGEPQVPAQRTNALPMHDCQQCDRPYRTATPGLCRECREPQTV
ncbi:hypothetical protein ACIGZJ_31035 [Kitasatospora sp. NPDC052868]|uniref:hypothetical protein n=1 Tax=Kitasatospora sp. NPDC052868 TaxID=3364060 RepID=UPI0037C5BD26